MTDAVNPSRRLGDSLEQFLQRDPAPVYRTGVVELDRFFDGGIRAGETTLIGGFTSHAKSALGEQIALDLSIEIETLYLCLELGRYMQMLRMGSKIARTSLGSFRRTGLDAVTKAELNARKLEIWTPRKRTMAKIEEAIARRQHQVIVVDDFRAIEGVVMEGNSGSHAHAYARRLTELAEFHGVHIIILQQLDPGTYRHGPARWRFQDSTVLEQRAYNSVTVFRPFKDLGGIRDTVAEIRIRKNRYGDTGMFHLRWVGASMSFWDLSAEELENLECCKKKPKKGAAS